MRIKKKKQTEIIQISDLRSKADQGNAQAQSNLGVLYFKGHGVLQDYAMARQWFEKAAAQGHVAAMFPFRELNESTKARSNAA
jgi:TPR repeat protein